MNEFKREEGMEFPYAKMILLIDSSHYSAKLTSRYFRSWGFSTEVAHSTAAAGKMLKNGEVFPDLIFVEMPNTNAATFKFPQDVRANPLWGSVPIMIRCPSADRQNILRAIECGYCDYIVRPTEPDVLREKIEKALRPSLRIDAATFSLPIKASATTSLALELTRLSEFGVEGYCNQPLQPNSMITVTSAFLEQFELASSSFRVLGCEEEGNRTDRYKLALTFIGLRPQSATLIRKYLLGQSAKALVAA